MLYSESDLVIPALEALFENSQGLSTKSLIKILIQRLEPMGKDAKIIYNRHDTYFSQKVRNLKSHNTLERHNLAKYCEGIFKITEKGKSYLASGIGEVAQALQDQGFSERDRKREYEKNYADILVEEGRVSYRNKLVRKRSRILTEIAKKKFTNKNGQLICTGCGFDFEERYNGRGKGYIEIHHLKPIHQHDITGEKQIIKDALKRLVPLCSNCHRMIHRESDNLLSIEQLQEIVIKQNVIKSKKLGL